MRRVTLVVVIALAITVLAGAPGSASPLIDPAPIDPVLQRQLDAAAPDQTVDAIVVLDSQADVSRVQARARAQRLRDVEGILRAHAGQAQKGILGLLAQRRAQGLVTGVRPLWIVNEVSVQATPAVIRELATRPEVREVRPNATIQAPEPLVAPAAAAPESNVGLVNAPALWDLGFTGQGIVVANMDTGVDATHPDLALRYRGGTNSWYDPNGQHPTTPTDRAGHGTSTMGVMVGGDAGGTSIGMAPGAQWIAVKIFNDSGSATATNIHAGFQWLLNPDGDPATADAPHIVNNSWTMSGSTCNLEFQSDLRSLRAAGIVPVFSAGNNGPFVGSVGAVANNPEALAVGATDDSDVIASFSGRGPSACSGAVSPRLAAPGVTIRTSDLSGGYRSVSGTSFAAPHVAGALALLLGPFPGLSADRQEAALQSSAVDFGASGLDNDYGYGRLDVLAAYNWLSSTPDFTVSTSPASATTTPGGSASYTVSVAGANGFTGDVALSLAGLPSEVASYAFDPAVVSGAGSSQLTITTAPNASAGSYPLTITGTSGTITRTSTASLVVEPPPPPPDFGLTATPDSQTVVAGAGTAYTVDVSALDGFTSDVALSLAGLPTGLGWSHAFDPLSVTGAGSSQLTITTPPDAAAGLYPLNVTGTSGSISHTAAITLVVGQPDFALSASPSSVTVRRGRVAYYTVSVSSVDGFTGAVKLSLSGRPRGATYSFSPNPVAAPGSSTLKVKTTSTTKRGTFTLWITGTSGAIVHRTSVTLIVR